MKALSNGSIFLSIYFLFNYLPYRCASTNSRRKHHQFVSLVFNFCSNGAGGEYILRKRVHVPWPFSCLERQALLKGPFIACRSSLPGNDGAELLISHYLDFATRQSSTERLDECCCAGEPRRLAQRRRLFSRFRNRWRRITSGTELHQCIPTLVRHLRRDASHHQSNDSSSSNSI